MNAIVKWRPQVDSVYQMDAELLLRALPDGSVDLLLTDPPYGVHEASWDTAPAMKPLWAEIKRAMKPRGAVVFTSVQPFTTDLISSNREWFKYTWVWAKTLAGDFFNAKNKPLRLHEDIVVFSAGTVANKSPNRLAYYPQGLTQQHKKHSRPYSAKYRRDSEQIARTRPSWKTSYTSEYSNYPGSVLYFAHGNNHTKHPNEKPVALFEYLICTYTRPGDLVVDCYMGSGTTAIASRRTNRRFIGSDISSEYVSLARNRLALPFAQDMFASIEGAAS